MVRQNLCVKYKYVKIKLHNNVYYVRFKKIKENTEYKLLLILKIVLLDEYYNLS